MPDSGKNLISVGTYDGVHLGHRKLISALVSRAKERNMSPLALYFPVPPKLFFRNTDRDCLLTLPEEREKIINGLGADALCMEFNKSLASLEAGDFFCLLRDKYNAGGIVSGADFAFGRERKGNVSFLRGACAKNGLSYYMLDSLEAGGAKISSTAIRKAVRTGNFEYAERMLGRPYCIETVKLRQEEGGLTVAAERLKLLPLGSFFCFVPELYDYFQAERLSKYSEEIFIKTGAGYSKPEKITLIPVR